MRGGIKTKEEFTNKKIRVVRDHDLTMESTKTTKLLKINISKMLIHTGYNIVLLFIHQL